MEWDQTAVGAFIKMPLADSIKANARIFTEKMARHNGRDRVTPEEIEQTKRVYFNRVPEAVRQREYDKRIAAGETDLPERMEKAARSILATNGEIFRIDTCRAGYSFCPTQVFNLRGIQKEAAALLKRLEYTERLTDKLSNDAMILAHHRFTVAFSGCINGCSTPEAKSFGAAGTARPRVTTQPCSQCFACVDVCKRGAIVIRDGGPVINFNLCDGCGQCIKACPEGVLEVAKKGYKVFVGGRLGRFHQPGYELFKMVNQAGVLKALEATVETYLAEAEGDEHLTALLNRIGLSPIYQRIYQAECPTQSD